MIGQLYPQTLMIDGLKNDDAQPVQYRFNIHVYAGDYDRNLIVPEPVQLMELSLIQTDRQTGPGRATTTQYTYPIPALGSIQILCSCF